MSSDIMQKTKTTSTIPTNLTYSIIIPNYNGLKLIGPCLDSIANQTLKPLETIVVDDGSSDNSVEFIARNYPWVKQVVRERNGLFAAACNSGFEAAQGNVLILFNNDAEAESGWLEAINQTLLERPEIDMVASKILLHDRPHIFHAVGDYYQANGVPGNRGVWQEDRGQYNQTEEVFGPCGAAAAYRRAALDEVRADNADGKILDESLVMYLEDVDLSLRLRLRGKRCLYVPGAVVHHHLSATGGGVRASYQCGRNFLVVALKNMPDEVLRQNLGNIILSQLGYALFSLRHLRLNTERARLRGQWDALKAIPQTLRQRKKVQSARTVSPQYFETLLGYKQS